MKRQHIGFSGVGTVCIYEALEDITHRLVGRMDHILGIETIVTQFIQHYFECRKIRPLR